MSALAKYERYKDSGIEWLGEIPEHWELRRFKYLFDFSERGTAPNYSNVGTTVVNQACLSTYKINLDKAKFHQSKDNPKTFRGWLQKNDLLVASTGMGVLGKCALYDTEEEAFADSHITVIRDSKHRLSTKFVYYIFSTLYDFINANMAEGATKQTELQRDDLHSFILPLPTDVEVEKILDFLNRKTAEINQAIIQKNQLIELLKEQKTILIIHHKV